MTPRLSVLLPFRDAAPTLGTAVRSILSEREVPLDVIAVDDGSSDAGPQHLANIARTDDRLRLVRTAPLGLVHALRTAVTHARGDFLARMDADDETLPGRFAAQLDALARDRSLGVVGTQVEAHGDVGEGLRCYLRWQNSLVTPAEHARDLFVESPLCHPSVMMRRDAYDKAGGYVASPFPEDYDLWLRIAATGSSLAKLPRVLLRWRRHDGQLTWRDPRYGPERFRALKARFLARRLKGLDRPFAVWGAGRDGRRLARALEPEGARPTRFIDIDPKKIGRTARGVPIVPPEALAARTEFVVAAVGTRGARALIRARLTTLGYREGPDFLCAA